VSSLRISELPQSVGQGIRREVACYTVQPANEPPYFNFERASLLLERDFGPQVLQIDRRAQLLLEYSADPGGGGQAGRSGLEVIALLEAGRDGSQNLSEALLKF
jgi:hypothetical protein